MHAGLRHGQVELWRHACALHAVPHRQAGCVLIHLRRAWNQVWAAHMRQALRHAVHRCWNLDALARHAAPGRLRTRPPAE